MQQLTPSQPAIKTLTTRTHRLITFTEKSKHELVPVALTPTTVATPTDVQETVLLIPVVMTVAIIVTVVDTIVKAVAGQLATPNRVELGTDFIGVATVVGQHV